MKTHTIVNKLSLIISLACITLACSGFYYNNDIPTKYIFTGGPGAGKTSTLLYLEAVYGEHHIAEAAADVQNLIRAQGNQEPWTDPLLNKKIVELQLQREQRIHPNNKGRVLLDRCPIDVWVYAEKNPFPLLIKAIERIKDAPDYAKTVFLFDNLDHVAKTTYRYEELEYAKELARKQEINYVKNGFNVVHILPGTVKERAEFILNAIEAIENHAPCTEAIPSG